MTNRPDYEGLREQTPFHWRVAGGTSRAQIGERVGEAGKRRFWDHWPE